MDRSRIQHPVPPPCAGARALCVVRCDMVAFSCHLAAEDDAGFFSLSVMDCLQAQDSSTS